MPELKIGDTAPDFTLPTDGNGEITLSKLKGRKVVLYFYPKDDTPSYTTESCDFRDSIVLCTGRGLQSPSQGTGGILSGPLPDFIQIL